MKSAISLCIVTAALAAWTTLAGCASKADYDTCVRRNATQSARIDSLEAAQEQERIRADRAAQQAESLRKQYALVQQQSDVFRATLDAKNAIIAKLTEQLGSITPVALPAELSNALAEWARQSGSDLITYDAQAGVVQFKSDLLFDSGKAAVKSTARQQLALLAGVLTSPAAQGFDVLVVGHTDAQPIKRSADQHPTNWHLSAHRAIAVESILAEAGLEQTRLAVMGMGEFHPQDTSGKTDNPINRRVDIYIVPAGRLAAARSVTP